MLQGVRDLIERVPLPPAALESLADAGALYVLFDGRDRRALRWYIGLLSKRDRAQLPLAFPVEQDEAALDPMSEWGQMTGEYVSMGLYPSGHLMEHLRPSLRDVLTADELQFTPDGTRVSVAGVVIRRQRPLGKAVFVTTEDETGHAPLVVWPDAYKRLREVLRAPVVQVWGTISRREGTLLVVIDDARRLEVETALPRSKDWR